MADEASTLSGQKKSRCPGACPGGGMENSAFLWFSVVAAAAALVTLVFSGSFVAGNYMLSSWNWMWILIGFWAASAVFMVMAVVFAAEKFPDAGQTGESLSASHYSAAVAPSMAWFIAATFSAVFMIVFRKTQNSVLLDLLDQREPFWTLSGLPETITFATAWMAANLICFFGAVGTFMAAAKYIHAMIFPTMRGKARPTLG